MLEEQGREEKYVFICFLDSIPSTTSSEVGVSDGGEYFSFEIAEDFDELDVVQQDMTLSPAKFYQLKYDLCLGTKV